MKVIFLFVSGLYFFAPYYRADKLQVPCPGAPLALKHRSTKVPSLSQLQWESSPLAAICSLLVPGGWGAAELVIQGRRAQGDALTLLCRGAGEGPWSAGRAQGRAPVPPSWQVLWVSNAPAADRLHVSSAQLMQCNWSYLCQQSESSCEKSPLLPLALGYPWVCQQLLPLSSSVVTCWYVTCGWLWQSQSCDSHSASGAVWHSGSSKQEGVASQTLNTSTCINLWLQVCIHYLYAVFIQHIYVYKYLHINTHTHYVHGYG